MIDLDIMPADWKFAENHAKAVKPGIVDNLHTMNTSNVICQCCLKPIIKSQIPLGGNSKQLQFMGFGFPLYFIFLKYCIILLIVLICSYSAMSLYWALVDNYNFCSVDAHRRLLASSSSHSDPHCTSFMIRFSRIQKHLENSEVILRISSFVIHILALIYIRDNIQKTKQYYDQKTTTLSDYSLMFKNLPLKNNIQANIKKFINEHFTQQWLQLKKIYSSKEFQAQKKVMKVTLLPHTQSYFGLVNQKKQLIEQKRKIIKQEEEQKSKMIIPQYTIQNRPMKQSSATSKKISANEEVFPGTEDNIIHNNVLLQSNISSSTALLQINKLISQKNLQIRKICSQYQQLNKKDELHSQIAIVTLNSELFKNTILDFTSKNTLDHKVMQKYFGQFNGEIQILQAPQPTEIIWENVNYPMDKRLGRKIIGWIFTVVFLAVTTVGFYFLLLLKTNNLLDAIQQNNKNEYNVAVFLVFLALFLIVFFNKLFMGWVLHHFAHLEKHDNTFEQEFSFALKYTLGLFFTTALMTLAVQDITFHNFYSHEYGVIEEQSIMFFINAFLIPLIWLVNPWKLWNLAVRKYKKDAKHLTQGQANNIMSECSYTMGKRYAQIIETMWFTFLYATLIPGGAFLTIIGLSLYYWVDKYNLLRHSSLKNNISGQMALVSLKLLDLTLILRPLGQVLFDAQIRDGVNPESYVFIAIGALYFILPIGQIIGYFHAQQFKQEQKSFQDVKDTFLQTYQTLHPIFGNKKSQKVMEMLKKKTTTKNISLSKIQSRDLKVDYIFNNKQSQTSSMNEIDKQRPNSTQKLIVPQKLSPKVYQSRFKVFENEYDTKQKSTLQKNNVEIIPQQQLKTNQKSIHHSHSASSMLKTVPVPHGSASKSSNLHKNSGSPKNNSSYTLEHQMSSIRMRKCQKTNKPNELSIQRSIIKSNDSENDNFQGKCIMVKDNLNLDINGEDPTIKENNMFGTINSNGMTKSENLKHVHKLQSFGNK